MKRKLFHRRRPKIHRMTLTVIFSIAVFVIMLVAFGLAAGTVIALSYNKVILLDEGEMDLNTLILLMMAASAVLGWVIAFFVSRIFFSPIMRMINAINRLAEGEFDTRVTLRGPLKALPMAEEMCTSFNRMAEELQNTEMLRSDFVNNFSHEFKTPIVSIAGFADLLKNAQLTEEQKTEYVGIISEESKRLAHMATSVLNLTRVENQTILTEVKEYNVSEQIRSVILLLEKKWSEKEIGLSLDFDEYTLEGNEELLGQVWVNLLDNAVKFTPRGGEISVSITERTEDATKDLFDEEYIDVTVKNTGSEIAEDARERIFSKFYQADESHAGEGNGIGLAIVRKIVDLHGGDVTVESGNGATSFTVTLPKIAGTEDAKKSRFADKTA